MKNTVFFEKMRNWHPNQSHCDASGSTINSLKHSLCFSQRAVVTERRRAFFTEQAMKLVIQCMPWLQGHGSEEDEMGLACTSYWTHSDQTAGQTKRPKECVARCCKHFVQAKILVPPPPAGGEPSPWPKKGAHFAPPLEPPPPLRGGTGTLAQKA